MFNYNENRKEIKNKAVLKVEFGGETHCIESNEVELKKVNITVFKKQSRNLAFVGDCVQYTITVCNDSNINLYNLEFEDKLARDLKYVKDSFKINGRKEDPRLDQNELYYRINQLKDREELVITFEAIIERCA